MAGEICMRLTKMNLICRVITKVCKAWIDNNQSYQCVPVATITFSKSLGRS